MAYTNCDLILSVKDAEDHKKWLKTRDKGIGGSDAAVIMGLNPYKSPYQLWLERPGRQRLRTCQEINVFTGAPRMSPILLIGSRRRPVKR